MDGEISAFVVMVEVDFEYEDGQRESKGESVGEDDGDGVERDSIDEPEKDAQGKGEEHGEGDIASAAETPYAEELRDERDGGEDGGAIAGEGDERQMEDHGCGLESAVGEEPDSNG